MANKYDEFIKKNPMMRERIPLPHLQHDLAAVMEMVYTHSGGKGKVYRGHGTQVFYAHPSDDVPCSLEFKVHLMFNVQHLDRVLYLILQNYHKNKLRYPIEFLFFKVLAYYQVTTGIGGISEPYPLVTGSTANDWNSGKKNDEPAGLIYRPTEIKTYPLTYKGEHTYNLIDPSHDTPIEYEYEMLFTPVICFYTSGLEYTKKLIKWLQQIIPSDVVNLIKLPNYYPRSNVKINDIIYVAHGDFGQKAIRGMDLSYREKEKKIDTIVSTLPPLPSEYEEIVQQCPEQKEEKSCSDLNRKPLAWSNHKLCKWNENKCTPINVLSPHTLLSQDKKVKHYKSLEELYTDLDQLDSYTALSEQTPTEYTNLQWTSDNHVVKNQLSLKREDAVYVQMAPPKGGRRTRRKHKKRLTKKKSNRHHRR
jgi:hypothetical protein